MRPAHAEYAQCMDTCIDDHGCGPHRTMGEGPPCPLPSSFRGAMGVAPGRKVNELDGQSLSVESLAVVDNKGNFQAKYSGLWSVVAGIYALAVDWSFGNGAKLKPLLRRQHRCVEQTHL